MLAHGVQRVNAHEARQQEAQGFVFVTIAAICRFVRQKSNGVGQVQMPLSSVASAAFKVAFKPDAIFNFTAGIVPRL